MDTITLRLTGTSPILQHNVRLVDPLDPHTRELAAATKKKKKIEDDHRTIARIEFEGGLYYDEKLGPYVPSGWILKAIRDAAALSKQGRDIERGVVPMDDMCRLEYDGPRGIQEMWDAGMYDRRAVGVGAKKVMRTRPKFNSWSCSITLAYEKSVVDLSAIIEAVEKAGSFMGIGDGRRLRFGRFEVKKA